MKDNGWLWYNVVVCMSVLLSTTAAGVHCMVLCSAVVMYSCVVMYSAVMYSAVVMYSCVVVTNSCVEMYRRGK